VRETTFTGEGETKINAFESFQAVFVHPSGIDILQRG
jgi:hypothetical protein